MKCKLRIAGVHYEIMQKHLYPGDGKEAIAIALCGRLKKENEIIFLIHKIFPIPYEDCTERDELFLDWKTDKIQPILEEAEKNSYSVLKIHSHPTGIDSFSKTDDKSDIKFFKSVLGWTLDVDHHLSCIMLPGGIIIGRSIDENLSFSDLDKITVIGDDFVTWENEELINDQDSDANLRNMQAFGNGTIQKLKRLKVAVIGCSGTGSIVIEQLARLGVGELVLVDPEKIEKKNLNRIINATIEDVENERYKVNILKKAIESFGFGTIVNAFPYNLFDNKQAIKEVAACDVLFGCVDSADGRHLLNLISNFYLLPLFDIGVRLEADGKGGIDSINGTVNYIQPGRSSLLARGVYTPEQLQAAGQYRKNPEQYALLEKEKYLKKVNVDSPAVISINMFYSCLAVNDFLARIHPFRIQQNKDCAIQRFVLTEPYFFNESADAVDSFFIKNTGRGDAEPLLKLPELS